MADRYDITCACGYTNRVPASALGSTRECVNCSADLFIDPDTAAPVEDRTDPDYEKRLRAAEAAGRPADLRDGPAALTAAKPAPPPQPLSKSPFADDDEDETEINPFAVPSPEIRGVDDVERAPSRHRYVEIPTVSSLDKETGESCSSCGRTIRGAWDRVETPGGVICYICSNQATESIPERIKDRPEPRHSDEPPVLYDVPERERPETARGLLGIDTESEGFKQVLRYVAFGVIAFALFIYFTGALDSPQQASTRNAGDTSVEAPAYTGTVLLLWQMFVTPFVAMFLSLYFVLSMTDNLPHDRFWRDATYLSFFCTAFMLFHGAVVFALHYIAQVPIAGPVYSILLPLAEILVFGLVFNHYLNMRILAIIFVFIAYRIFGAVVNIVSAGLFGLFYEAIR